MFPGSERKVSRAPTKTFEREITKNRIVALFFFHGVEKTRAIDRRERVHGQKDSRRMEAGRPILSREDEPTRRRKLRGVFRQR
jgi:hypothetical protein